jgi:hypothetical protein
METSGGGIFGRLSEKVLGYIALALIVLAGIGLWQMGAEGRGALWGGIWRTTAWLVITAAIPWTARLFIGRILEIGSNSAGLALIAGFTLANGIVGLILLGGLPAGGWGWTASLAALAAAGTYNFLVAEYLSEQAGG